MGTNVDHQTICWCGNSQLEAFSSDYLHCPVCETLVWKGKKLSKQLQKNKRADDYYEMRYWFDHQIQELELPDITSRARTDLPERCLYWLQTLLKYCLPSAKILELGSSHGGFLALLQLSGYEACGLELSEQIVEFARKTFRVQVFHGPIEKQTFNQHEFDAIIAFDVLEHLMQPKESLDHCMQYLKPGGLCIIQTPAYPSRNTFDDLKATNHPFVKMLIPEEHIHLFSQQSISSLFKQVGLQYMQSEQPLFAQYDMYVVASRQDLIAHTTSEVEQCLLSSADGRIILAMLDLYNGIQKQEDALHKVEKDCEQRLTSINELENLLKQCQADREARLKSMQELEMLLHDSELDRKARLASIHELQTKIIEIEADRSARLEAIHELENLLAEAEADRTARLLSIQELEIRLKEIELDRNARLDSIQELENQLKLSEADRAARLEAIHKLENLLQVCEADRAARLESMQNLEKWLAESQADRSARLEVIEQLTKELDWLPIKLLRKLRYKTPQNSSNE